MPAITAQAVNEFRKRTGLGLMECKALLQEADGDLKKAEILAKERGLKNAEKRMGREAKAGRVEVAIAPDSRSGALAEINCETDFVARNDAFRALGKELAEHVLANGTPASIDELKTQAFHADPSKTIADVLVDVNARTGENVAIARVVKLDLGGPGKVDAYIHHDAKSGALVAVAAPDDATAQSDAVSTLVKDLALQVVAAKPLSVKSDELPAEAVAEQKAIFVTQAADKPEAMRDKIATGKLQAWFREVALVDQVFVKDAAVSVKDIVSKAGSGLEVKSFARYVVGEAGESA
jgi:elongation factor Ts